jgi:hypothetical protein
MTELIKVIENFWVWVRVVRIRLRVLGKGWFAGGLIVLLRVVLVFVLASTVDKLHFLLTDSGLLVFD